MELGGIAETAISWAPGKYAHDASIVVNSNPGIEAIANNTLTALKVVISILRISDCYRTKKRALFKQLPL